MGRRWQKDYNGVDKAILREYQGAKFILNIREEEEWMCSVDNHFDMRDRLVLADLPNLPPGFGRKPLELATWVREHWENTVQFFKDMEADDRLLLLDIALPTSTVKQTLESFLDLPVEWKVVNATRDREYYDT